MSARLDFENHHRDSDAWRIVRTYIDERIQELRVSNDNNKDAIETANIRGRITELKNLLTKATPSPAPVVNDG